MRVPDNEEPDGTMTRVADHNLAIVPLPPPKVAYPAAQWLVVGSSVGLATALTMSLPPLREATSTMLFVVAVLVSLWSGGLRYAMLAAALSTLLWMFVIVPPQVSLEFSSNNPLVRLLVFFLVVALVSAVYAMHQKRRLEMVTRESRLRLAMHSASMGVLDYSAQAGECWFSFELQQILGSPNGVSPSFGGYLAFVHPADRPRLLHMMTRAAGHSPYFEITHRVLRRDGTECTVRLRGRFFVTEDGVLERMIAMVTEITGQTLQHLPVGLESESIVPTQTQDRQRV